MKGVAPGTFGPEDFEIFQNPKLEKLNRTWQVAEGAGFFVEIYDGEYSLGYAERDGSYSFTIIPQEVYLKLQEMWREESS